MAILAANPQETVFKTAALEEVVEFLLNVAWKILALSFHRGLEGWVVLLSQLVKQRLLGLVTFVVWRLARRGAPCQRHGYLPLIL